MTQFGTARGARHERLRVVARQRATASLLERRAGRSANDVLAAVLRERAARRRRAAERLAAGLPLAG
jgi:hypothetical protein